MTEKNSFLPEGSIINTAENKKRLSCKEEISRTMENRLIVEGEVVLCDNEHNLILDIGGMRGIIPHRDTALGIESGTTREIAILSLVGKPVSCIINGVDYENKTAALKLSRAEAQRKALRHIFDTSSPGDIIPARITHPEQFGAFVDIGCGNISFIGIEAISVSRISHTAERFNTGDDIYVAITSLDEEKHRVSLTHRELLGTWEENASRIKAGETVCGIIRGIEKYGVFIELSPNLSGLAEFDEEVKIGDCVSVFVKSIIPEKMKIKLNIIEKLQNKTRTPIRNCDYFIKSGHIDEWRYSPESCLRKRIFTIF